MGGRLWVPVASGPLASCAVGYGSWLAARGYSRWTISHRLWQLDLLSRWLEREGLRPNELTSRVGRAILGRPPLGGLFDVGVGAERGVAARVLGRAGECRT